VHTRRTVLLLPGQGAQRERMAAGLYGVEPVFTETMDAFFDAYGPERTGLRADWLRPAPNPELDRADTAQPLLFAVGLALGRAVGGWGAEHPGILLGHSAGELAAACLAGVFTERDAPALMAARSAALIGAPSGGMLAVAARPAELSPFTGADVTVAAVNGPRQTVLAGPDGPLALVEQRLRDAGVTARRLRSDHAFHSPSLAAAAQRFGRGLATVRLRPPTTELWSGRTGGPVSAAQAGQPDFWARQLALPVRFWAALGTVLDGAGDGPGLLLLDASPDRSLSAAARRHPAVRSGAALVLPLLGAPPSADRDDAAVFAEARRAALSRQPEQSGPAQPAAVTSSPDTWAMSAAGVLNSSISSSVMRTE